MTKEQYKATVEKVFTDFLESSGPYEIAEMKSPDDAEPSVEQWNDAFSCFLYDNTI